MDKKRIIKVAICSFISAIIWCTVSKCFAVENIPQTVQENYYSTINWYNSTTSNGVGKGSTYFNISYLPAELMTKSVADIILNDVDNKILSYITEEELSEYKYYNLVFNSSEKYIGLYVSKNCSQNTSWNYSLNVSDIHYFKYNYDTNYNISFDYHVQNTDTTYTISSYAYSSSNYKIQSIFLGTTDITSWTNNTSWRYTGPFVKALTISSSTTYPKVDPTKDYENNFVLNWSNLKGDQLTLDYDIFYYDENGNAISVKDLVYYLSSDINYGSIMSYYLSPSNIKLLPNNTTFYLRSIFKTNYNYTTSSYGPLIISDNTTKMFTTGISGTGGDTGGEDTPGGDAGGSNVDLGNIENTLGEINTSIIEVGSQTNENLQDIEQAIQETNQLITEEPTTSEDEFSQSFPTVEIEDPSEDFFTWIFENIEDIFLSTEEQVFEFNLYTDTVYTISTEQIKVTDSELKTLVGLSIDFGICYWILKDVRKTINKVKEGNIEALADEDITANMV